MMTSTKSMSQVLIIVTLKPNTKKSENGSQTKKLVYKYNVMEPFKPWAKPIHNFDANNILV